MDVGMYIGGWKLLYVCGVYMTYNVKVVKKDEEEAMLEQMRWSLYLIYPPTSPFKYYPAITNLYQSLHSQVNKPPSMKLLA